MKLVFTTGYRRPRESGGPGATAAALPPWIPAFAGMTTRSSNSLWMRDSFLIRHSVIRDLDQILVRIADIDRLYRADGTRARPRPGHDRHSAMFEVCCYLGERHRSDEAQISRPRRRLVGDETGNVARGMQVDLLLSEAQRGASFAKADDLHTEHARVEFAGARDVGDGQN